MLWDLNEGKHLYTLDGGDTINALCFSPNRYWLCAATGPSIKIWVSYSVLSRCKFKVFRVKLKCLEWNIFHFSVRFSDGKLMPSVILWWYKRLFLRPLIYTFMPFGGSVQVVACSCVYSLPLLFCLLRTSRERSSSMNWDRKWSAPTAKPSPHSALLWPGLLMDR